MANSVVIEHHFKTLKRVLEENELRNKCNKIFNTDESSINMDLRQGKVVISRGSKGMHPYPTCHEKHQFDVSGWVVFCL